MSKRISLKDSYSKLYKLLTNYTYQQTVYFREDNPFLNHTRMNPVTSKAVFWIKPPAIESWPGEGLHWRVPAIIAAGNLTTVLTIIDDFINNYSQASYWRNIRPLPASEIGIWDGWEAVAVDLFIDWNHICETTLP